MAWTREQAREIGRQKGGRPKGSQNRAKLIMRELATMIVTNPKVQEKLLKQAIAGTLHPRVLIELFHYHGGRPLVRVEVERPKISDDRRRMLERLTEEQREQYANILLAMDREPLQLAPPSLIPRAGAGPSAPPST